MDRLFRNKSAQFSCSQDNEETFRDNVLKKLGFLNSFKNYVVSKFRSDKYEVNDSNNHEIDIISYDHHNFNDVEKKYDLISLDPLTIDEKVARVMKNALSQIPKEELSKITKERLELLQVVERTFNRQLDIFEGLLQVNLEKTKGKKLNLHKKKITEQKSEGAVDHFINYLINNIVQELKSDINSEITASIKNNEETIDKNLGDNSNVKLSDIKCECQKLNASGAAVSKIIYQSSTNGSS